MPRYRIDRREPIADAQIAYYTYWMGGPTLAGVGNCRIAGLPATVRRSVRVTGEADTYFSIPAETSIGGRTIKGYLTTYADDGAYEFRPSRVGRGRMWRALIGRVERTAILRHVAAGWHSGQGSRGFRVLGRTAAWLRRRQIGLTIGNVQTANGDPLQLVEYLIARDPLCAAFADYLTATFTVRDGNGWSRRYQRRVAL